jgi:hypothetical protein
MLPNYASRLPGLMGKLVMEGLSIHCGGNRSLEYHAVDGVTVEKRWIPVVSTAHEYPQQKGKFTDPSVPGVYRQFGIPSIPLIFVPTPHYEI